MPLPLLALDGAHWFALWLLDRVLREVEEHPTPRTRETEYVARCWWCGKEHVVYRPEGDGPPDDPPKGWLLGRVANHPSAPFWCSRRCWSEDFERHPAIGYPVGDAWDAALDADVPED